MVRALGDVPKQLEKATGCTSEESLDWETYIRTKNGVLAPYDAFFQEVINVGKNKFSAGDLLLYKDKSAEDFALVEVVDVRFVWILVKLVGCAKTDVRWVPFNDLNLKPIESEESAAEGTYRGATEPVQFLKYNWQRWIRKELEAQADKIADPAKFYTIDESWRPTTWKIKVGQCCLAYDDGGFNGVLCPMTISAIDKNTNEVTLQYDGYADRHVLRLDYFNTRLIYSYEMAHHMGLHIGPPLFHTGNMVPFRYRLTLRTMDAEEITLSDTPPANFVFQTAPESTRAGDTDTPSEETVRRLNKRVDEMPSEYRSAAIPPPPVQRPPSLQQRPVLNVENNRQDPFDEEEENNQPQRSPLEDATDTSSEGEADTPPIVPRSVPRPPMQNVVGPISSTAPRLLVQATGSTFSLTSLQSGQNTGLSSVSAPRIQPAPIISHNVISTNRILPQSSLSAGPSSASAPRTQPIAIIISNGSSTPQIQSQPSQKADSNLPGPSRTSYTAKREKNLVEKEKKSGVAAKVMDHLNLARAKIEETEAAAKKASPPAAQMPKTPYKIVGRVPGAAGSPTKSSQKATESVPEKPPKKAATLLPVKRLHLVRTATYQPAKRAKEAAPSASAAQPAFISRFTAALLAEQAPTAAQSAVQSASVMVKPVARIPSETTARSAAHAGVSTPSAPANSSSGSETDALTAFSCQITVQELNTSKAGANQINPHRPNPNKWISSPEYVTMRIKENASKRNLPAQSIGYGATQQKKTAPSGLGAVSDASTARKKAETTVDSASSNQPITKRSQSATGASSRLQNGADQSQKTSEERTVEEDMLLILAPSSSRAPAVIPRRSSRRIAGNEPPKKIKKEDEPTSPKALHTASDAGPSSRLKDPTAIVESMLAETVRNNEPPQAAQQPPLLEDLRALGEIFKPSHFTTTGINSHAIDKFHVNVRFKCRIGLHLNRSKVESIMKTQYRGTDFCETLQRLMQDLVHCVPHEKLANFLKIFGAFDGYERRDRPAFELQIYGQYGHFKKYVELPSSIFHGYLWLKDKLQRLNCCPHFIRYAGPQCEDCGIQYERNPPKWNKEFKGETEILEEELVPLPPPVEISKYFHSRLGKDSKNIAKILLDHEVNYSLMCQMTEEILHLFIFNLSKAEALKIMALSFELRKSIYEILPEDKRDNENLMPWF